MKLLVRFALWILEKALDRHDWMHGVNWETCPISYLDRIETKEIQTRQAFERVKGVLLS